MAVKAKKKTKKPSAKQTEREIDAALDKLDQQADELYAYAHPIYKAQDENTRLALDRLTETMDKMATAPKASVQVEGYETPAVVRVEKAIRDKVFLYIAVRLLVYSARMDVRIGKFKFLPKSCVECGRKVK